MKGKLPRSGERQWPLTLWWWPHNWTEVAGFDLYWDSAEPLTCIAWIKQVIPFRLCVTQNIFHVLIRNKKNLKTVFQYKLLRLIVLSKSPASLNFWGSGHTFVHWCVLIYTVGSIQGQEQVSLSRCSGKLNRKGESQLSSPGAHKWTHRNYWWLQHRKVPAELNMNVGFMHACRENSEKNHIL